ncbi:hypothetical protein ACIB15232_0941 [Aliarcobacter cibarius]|uniref:hypothetical protein n=1 Tax=Aliarcobacter cibarius TaxID=255507 RepID=UPI00124666D9|nr:hypothetical protein [Aliarcobacter cibarius]QEZ89059.1 hypothetical protein ACIB15232_0941 [Aliarcobacter cibarius]
MINLDPNLENCVCKSNHNPHISCQNEYTLLEKGQALQLKPANHREVVKLIPIDGCVINNSTTSKCDGLFLYQNSKNVIYSFLFELKNTEKWPKPVDQIDKVRNLDFYKDLIQSLNILRKNEKFVVVGSYIPTKIEKQKIESIYGIRIISIIRQINAPYPDLKNYI